MSIAIRFYTFNKRNNSTKQTPATGYTTYNCVLKEDTSILEPTIKLQGDFNLALNYAHIPTFSRYYFVTDVVSSKGFWYISLKYDSMASYKTSIGAMSTYVLRSASEHDEYILDTAYPADSYITERIANPVTSVTEDGITYTSDKDPFRLWNTNSYCYVLGIIGYGSSALGSVSYYAMDQSQLNFFMSYLFGATSTWSDIDTSDYSDGVQRALLNPMQYIVSCIMLPFSASSCGTATDTIRFGTYELEAATTAAYLLDSLVDGFPIKNKLSYILLPSHPQASTRGKYLNGAPYSKYWLHLGPYGDIPLNGNIGDLITTGATDTDRYITIEMLFDLTSGICEALIKPGLLNPTMPFAHQVDSNYPRLATVSFQAGISIQLAQAYTDPLAIQQAKASLISNAAGAVVGAISNPVGSAIGSISSITTGVGDIMRTSYPTVSATGVNGSIIQGRICDEDIYIRSEHNRIVQENNDELGRPLCQVKTLNTLSGFILCSGADFGAAATQIERDEINNYLNSGFFYE